MDDRLPDRDIVLIGAGHTNMHVVRMWRMQPLPDSRLTIISPYSRATYSGMLPGTLAGLYEPHEMEIDLWRFAAPSGVRVIIDEAIGLDVERRRVRFRDRPPVRFDVASIGVGSVPTAADRWPDCPALLPIKPMATFRRRLQERIDLLRRSDRSNQHPCVCIVGAGAAGVEVTLCLDAWLRSMLMEPQVTLIDSGEQILDGYLPGTVRLVERELNARGIQVIRRSRVTDVRTEESSGAAVLTLQNRESNDRRATSVETVAADADRTLSADVIIWVTGASPPPLIRDIDLPKGPDGFLAVWSTLQTTAPDCPVFAVGDSASLIDSPVNKAGVFAVREGPILWDNISRLLSNKRLTEYEPQHGFLSLLADGQGGAFLDYKRIAAHGRWAWHLKDHIDRKFMRMYQDYQPMAAPLTMPSRGARSAATDVPAMRCRGCGGKAGANVLTAAFERLAVERPDLAHRAVGEPEDAALLDPRKWQAELVTVDFFQAFMDDPWLVGRVAALNSLSDIQATGGNPRGALAMVQLPEGEPRQQTEMLFQVLAGALDEFDRAGVELLGGHTTEASVLTVGFTILGSLDGRPPLRKAGACPGDVLLLTKPLGTGALLAGIPQALTRGEWVDTMLASMLRSNADAASIASEVGVSALTDVTGFGLAGHLLEMLTASGVSAELDLSTLPLLPGFEELAASGIESTLAPANRQSESRIRTQRGSSGAGRIAALFDPQTSGGLLIACSAEQAETLLDQIPGATGIGVVTESAEVPVITV